jgi:hypothetical protein
MDFKNDGRHVRSIRVLAEWLKILVDDRNDFILGVFPEESPKDVVAYEKDEGDKFLSKITEVTKTTQIWYVTLDLFYSSSPDNLAAQATKMFLKEIGVGAVNRESSLLRLLPFKSDADSIEFLSPPFQMAEKKGDIEIDSFEMINKLYQQYLYLNN